MAIYLCTVDTGIHMTLHDMTFISLKLICFIIHSPLFLYYSDKSFPLLAPSLTELTFTS